MRYGLALAVAFAASLVAFPATAQNFGLAPAEVVPVSETGA